MIRLTNFTPCSCDLIAWGPGSPGGASHDSMAGFSRVHLANIESIVANWPSYGTPTLLDDCGAVGAHNTKRDVSAMVSRSGFVTGGPWSFLLERRSTSLAIVRLSCFGYPGLGPAVAGYFLPVSAPTQARMKRCSTADTRVCECMNDWCPPFSWASCGHVAPRDDCWDVKEARVNGQPVK